MKPNITVNLDNVYVKKPCPIGAELSGKVNELSGKIDSLSENEDLYIYLEQINDDAEEANL